MRRDLPQARRLELDLVRLRWLVALFGAILVVIAVRGGNRVPDFAVPFGMVLVAALAAGNLTIDRLARRAEREEQLIPVGVLAFALDLVVVLGLVWVTARSPSDPAWVLGYLLPLEGAVRYGLGGALAPIPLLFASEVARETYLAARFGPYSFDGEAVVFRVGMATVVALAVGMFARAMRHEADRANERTRMAEEAAGRAEVAAKNEEQARRDLTAFHTAILAGVASEDPNDGMQAIAEAVGRQLECDALGVLLLETGEGGGEELVSAGVFGDPGYARGTRFAGGTAPLVADGELARPSLRTYPAEAVVPLRAGGQVIGILHERSDSPGSIDRDRLVLLGRLADQVSLVVQAARLRARQEDTLRRLRELDEMKSDFVAITSHELRTPLSAIRGFVDSLRRRLDELSPEEIQEFLEIIHVQTERLIRLVEDLLLVSRIEAGKLTLVPEVVDTSSLLRHVLLGIGEGATRVEVHEEPGFPASMVVDPQRLSQILTNLLVNALKFSPPDSTVRMVAASRSPDTVTFAVRDDGPGIEREEATRIFDRFHQTESAAAHSAGAGLGLYIAKQLAEAMGGWIDVESEQGTGSVFSITVPLARSLQAPAPLSGAGRAG